MLFPLVLHIPNLTRSDVSSLRSKRLMFLDQIISEDNAFLFTFDEIKELNLSNWKRRTPNWFLKLQDHSIWNTQQRRLINPPNAPPIQHFSPLQPVIHQSPKNTS